MFSRKVFLIKNIFGLIIIIFCLATVAILTHCKKVNNWMEETMFDGEFNLTHVNGYWWTPSLYFSTGDSVCIIISNLNSNRRQQLLFRKGGSGGEIKAFWFNLSNGRYVTYVKESDNYVVMITPQEHWIPGSFSNGHCKVVRKYRTR